MLPMSMMNMDMMRVCVHVAVMSPGRTHNAMRAPAYQTPDGRAHSVLSATYARVARGYSLTVSDGHEGGEGPVQGCHVDIPGAVQVVHLHKAAAAAGPRHVESASVRAGDQPVESDDGGTHLWSVQKDRSTMMNVQAAQCIAKLCSDARAGPQQEASHERSQAELLPLVTA